MKNAGSSAVIFFSEYVPKAVFLSVHFCLYARPPVSTLQAGYTATQKLPVLSFNHIWLKKARKSKKKNKKNYTKTSTTVIFTVL